MKLSQLLLQRDVLLRQAHLANLAYAYWHMEKLATRIAGARLRGEVCLQFADPAAERYWPVLTALAGSQSVVDEHFTDENVVDLADLVTFITGDAESDARFCLEEMAETFLTPLRRELERAGVVLGQVPSSLAEPNEQSPGR